MKNINFQDDNAEYAISLRKCAQGKGYAKIATEEVLAIAFQEMDLQFISLS